MSESLTHTVNFSIGSAFPKGPESAFSEGLGAGPGPLYKVCRLNTQEFWKLYGLFVKIKSMQDGFSRFL